MTEDTRIQLQEKVIRAVKNLYDDMSAESFILPVDGRPISIFVGPQDDVNEETVCCYCGGDVEIEGESSRCLSIRCGETNCAEPADMSDADIGHYRVQDADYPKVQVGEYTICREDDECVWIQTDEGEGGQFRDRLFEATLKEFFDKHF